MRLYAQTILIVTLTILAVAAVLLIVFDLTVISSLSALEQEYVTQDLNRTENALAGDAERLLNIAQDWAVWDATYEYVQNRDPGFYNSTFTETTLTGLNIDILAVYDLHGNLIAGLEYNPEHEISVPISREMDDWLKQSGLIVPDPKTQKGILKGTPFPLIVATYPVLTSHMKGPALGTVFVARQLDDNKVDLFSQDLQRNITIILLSPQEVESLRAETAKTGRFSSLSPDDRVVSDIAGNPSFIIRIPPSGDLSRSGLYSRAFLLASITVLAILFMGLASWLLNHIMILPLQTLNQDLLRIGKSGSLSERIRTDRKDEIGDLAVSINTMLSLLGEAQQERTRSEQRLSKVFEMVEEGICLVGPDGLIWFANPTMAIIFDTTTHDLNGVSLRLLLNSDDGRIPGKSDPAQPQQIPDLSEGMGEYHTTSLTGRDVWVRVGTTSYPLATGKLGQLCVITDITLFRTAERELLLSNKKLALLGSMTRHDIVNQLTTIRGMLGLIKRKNADPVLDTLIRSAEDASEKINKHVEFSKEYQKAGIEEPRWQDLRTIWNLAYAMARKRGLIFTITGKNYEIYADQLLQKVFYNLIDNSLRHGKDLFHITISSKTDGPDLLILYEDDGGGIPDTMKGRIFDRGVGTGTGWGLFFAHEVLNLTGMSITESGTYGIGAMFTIRVPEGVFRAVKSDEEKNREDLETDILSSRPADSDPDPEGDPGNKEHQH